MQNARFKINVMATYLGITFFLTFCYCLFPHIKFQDSQVKVSAFEETLVLGSINPESGLIVDVHHELVQNTCGGCHSLELVTQNAATREGWKEIIVWMQETQGLWDLAENEDLILDYLSKNYAPKKNSRRLNLENIEWYDL